MKKSARSSDVIVISQLPPPVHGSTLMTRVFLSALDDLAVDWRLVDRRFSRSIQDVGRFNFSKILAAIGLIVRLLWALCKKRPHATVFFATTRSFSFVMDWVLAELLRVFRVPAILYLHTVGFSELADRGRVWKFLVKRLFGTANLVVTLGDALVWDVDHFVSGEIIVIPNTLPEIPSIDTRRQEDKRDTVLFLSNLIPGKGHEDFLDIASQALQEEIDMKFVLAGGASLDVEKEVRDYISTAGIGKSVTYVGAVGGKAKWDLFRSASVFIFPSTYKYEASPLVLLEAASCGVPILGYRIGALAPLIVDSGAGHLVEPGARAQLAEQLISLLRSPNELRRMGEAARALYGNSLSFEVYRESWGSVLDQYVIFKDQAVLGK